jgi:hypothetical protein
MLAERIMLLEQGRLSCFCRESTGVNFSFDGALWLRLP